VNLEESILSSLDESANVERAWDLGLKADHFESPINRAVFEFILEYWFDSNRQVAPTIDVIEHEFSGFKYTKPKETLTWLIETIQGRYRDNGLADVLETVAQDLGSGDGDLALRRMSSMAWDLTQSITNRRSVSDMAENYDERRLRYAERTQFSGQVKGASTGLAEVDAHMYGILPSELAVLVGYAGTGKTWFLASAAIAALRAGWRPYLVSLELSRKDVEDRLDCLASGVPYTPMTRGELTPEETKALLEAQAEIRDTGSLFVDHPPMDERTVQSIVNRARQRGANYILLDQLSFIRPRKEYKTRTDSITEVTNELKVEISEDESKHMAVLMAAQFNREMKKTGKAELHNIALSSNIEQVVDHAFAISQNEEMKVNNAMLLDQMKNRRGANQKWLLNWRLKHSTHISVDRQIADTDLM